MFAKQFDPYKWLLIVDVVIDLCDDTKDVDNEGFCGILHSDRGSAFVSPTTEITKYIGTM